MRTELYNKGNQRIVKVTDYGQLVVAPYSFNSSVQTTASVINTAYNLIEPVAGKDVVLDGVFIAADKNVSSTTPATVTIYTADDGIETTPKEIIIELEVAKSSSVFLNGLNLQITEGNFLNIKTDDNNIFATVLFYRIDNGV